MIDKIVIELDKILKVLTTKPISVRDHPDENIDEAELSISEQKHSIGLMRVNHCGEICAQALYQGQAITSRDKVNRQAFERAALEEVEHLAWTQRRIHELGGRVSVLNPLFYLASLGMGIAAGVIGDKWNLGFLEETERQVESHLEKHERELPYKDKKSLAIVRQMKVDESLHAKMAHDFGATKLPTPIKHAMEFSSKIMTKVTYYL